MNLGKIRLNMGLPWCSVGNESSFNVGDMSSIPGLGRPSGGGNGNPLHYSCLENPMDREYFPWGHKESDMTEMTEHMHTNVYTHTHTIIFRFFSTKSYYKILNVVPVL